MSEEQKINIDDEEYLVSNLTDSAKNQIKSINFVDTQIQQLNNEWAVADTARIGYTNALKLELKKLKESE